MSAIIEVQKPQHRKERANPDWPVKVYSYWIEPIGDIPEWFWLFHDHMQLLWNDMVIAHDAFIDEREFSEESDGKWDTDRKRLEFSGLREKLKNVAKSKKGILPSSCYYEVRDRFLITMGRYWNPDSTLKRRRNETKNFDLGRPGMKFGRNKVLIPHDLNAANISTSILFSNKKPLTILQRTKQQGPTRGIFETLGYNFNFRINLHRPIPNGNIKRIAIVGEMVKPFGWQWRLNLTIEEPPVRPQRKNGRVAAIDLGWRLMDDCIRIGVLVDNSDNAIELSIPLDFANNSLRRQREHFMDVTDACLPIHSIPDIWKAQQESDLILEVCKNRLTALIPELLPNKVAWDKARHKSLIKLLNTLREDHPESSAIAVIEQWRTTNWVLHRRWRAAYERFMRWRREIYRVLAAEIASTYDEIVLEDRLNLAEMSRDEQAPPAIKASQKYRHWTSLYLFKECLKYAMDKQQKLIIAGKTAYSTATCSTCDGKINTDASLYLTCANGHTLDQDLNA